MSAIAVQVIINIISTAAIYLLVAVSFTTIYYPTKFFNLAHAATISLAAYLVYFFNQQVYLPISLSVLISIIVSGFIAALLELFLYKPMRKKNVSSLSLLIASIGIYVVIQNLISLIWGDETLRLNIGEVKTGNEIAGAFITDTQVLSISVSIILFLVVLAISRYTVFGKSLRAVSDNAELCNIYGINSNKIILYAFLLGSALAAFSGILSAADTNMKPTFGFSLLLYGVVAMIIGGVGSYGGLAAGALLVATAQHLAAYYIETKWMDAVAYLILIAFLIWKPYGFTGNRLRKIEI
jgi:branched-chain amino acid transport system permease protein